MNDIELTEVINTGKPLETKRAIAVRMVMTGWKRHDVAEALDVSVAFVDKWKYEYFEKGASALRLRYKGSRGYLSKEQHQAVLSWINEKATVSVDELCEYIMESYGVEYRTRKSYTDLIHKAGFAWKKTEKTNPKRDEALVETKKKKSRSSANLTETTSKKVV